MDTLKGTGPIVFGTAFALNPGEMRSVVGLARCVMVAHNSAYDIAEAIETENGRGHRRVGHHRSQVLRSTCAAVETVAR